MIARLASAGVDLSHTGTLFAATFLLSNVVSNVPAVMLLLPVWQWWQARRAPAATLQSEPS